MQSLTILSYTLILLKLWTLSKFVMSLNMGIPQKL